MNRVELAKEHFKNGYNCSQAVIAAYADVFGVDKETALRVAEGFGGGMGRMRGTCGAVTAMYMLAGLKHSKSQPKDLETRQKVYQLVQDMAKEFERMNGSTVCGDLLGVNKPKDTGAKPTPRDSEFFRKRPCIGCIEDAASIVEQYLIDK
jgi:C_GCAxxG_C_C family probable redox protein